MMTMISVRTTTPTTASVMTMISVVRVTTTTTATAMPVKRAQVTLSLTMAAATPRDWEVLTMVVVRPLPVQPRPVQRPSHPLARQTWTWPGRAQFSR
jgi:hypothetical protein